MSWSWLAGAFGSPKDQRQTAEFHRRGCFKDVENYVRACNTCHRVRKPHKKGKAPLNLTPLILEPFPRLVIDIVGPLPVTKSGYRYFLTVVCPATTFTEAIPMKEQSSAEVVNALLSIFFRIGFPQKI